MQPTPDSLSFKCPFFATCFKRELLRWLATAAIAAMTAAMVGCAFRLRTPTLDVSFDGRDIVKLAPTTQPAR